MIGWTAHKTSHFYKCHFLASAWWKRQIWDGSSVGAHQPEAPKCLEAAISDAIFYLSHQDNSAKNCSFRKEVALIWVCLAVYHWQVGETTQKSMETLVLCSPLTFPISSEHQSGQTGVREVCLNVVRVCTHAEREWSTLLPLLTAVSP